MTATNALETAIETAELNGFDPAKIFRALDTEYSERFPCYVVVPGIVVYEDEPNCVCSVEARASRFVPAPR